eukprot:15358247-Ditylum_brightwellii.AAC.1
MEIHQHLLHQHFVINGGQFGHLGLVCDATTYACTEGTDPYIWPIQPTLTFTAGGMQVQIQQANATYRQELSLFNDVNAVECVLIQQIVATIKPKYLKAIHYSVTNHITKTIPDIFTHRLDNYGDITSEKLYELKMQVKGLMYSPTEPLDTMFTEIEELADVSEIAKNPITEAQKSTMHTYCSKNKEVLHQT